MAGAIPSGSDPSGWEAGTVGSNPAQGYDPTAAAGAVVGTGATVSGQLSGVAAGISSMVSRTQDTITSAYQTQVQNNPTLTTLSNTMFEGLVNVDGTTPITTLLLVSLAQSLGVNISQLTTSSATLSAIQTAWSAVQTDASNAWAALEAFFQTGNYTDLKTAWNDLMLELFGSATTPGLIGSIPSSAITANSQNFQPVATFPNAASMVGGGGWSWDGTQDHTGTTGSGSANCVCDGTFHAMDGVPAPVQYGQTVTAQAYVMWSGVTAASGTSPFQLQLQPMQSNADDGYTPYGAPVVIASITSPASSSGWVELTGTYTVPTDATVTAVRLKLVQTADATAGSANWDDCTNNIAGGWLAELESDVQDILASFGAGGTAAEFTAGVTGLLSLFGLSSLTGSIDTTTIWTDVINDIINPIKAIETTVDNVIVDTENTLTNVFDWLFGIHNDPTASPVQAGSVGSVLGNTSLGADVSSVQGTATNASSWLTRLLTDLTIILDLLHFVYQPGTPSDAPGTLGTNGKPTWWSAVNDVLALFHITTTATAPAAGGATVGQAVAANTAAATTAGTNASMALASAATANTAAGAANTLAQGTIDGIQQASNGGTTVNNPVSSVVSSLTAIPASNIVGNTGAAAAFGAVGAGDLATGATSSLSASWTHTIATGDLGVLAAISYAGAYTGTWASSVTYGGIAMTKLESQACASTTAGGELVWLEFWWLKSPPSGTQTVAASVTQTGGSGVIVSLEGDSVSYSASKVGTVTPNAGGGGTSVSMTTASATGHMVVGAFTATSNTNEQNLTSFNQTQRYLVKQDSTVNHVTLLGDATGASSVTFSATAAETIIGWVGITVELEN